MGNSDFCICFNEAASARGNGSLLVPASLMVIYNLHSICIAFRPCETDAELAVDPDTVLPGSLAFKSFQPVPGKRRKIAEAARLMKLIQLAASRSFYGPKPF